MADTNYPAAPSGIFVLATPALGGVYLANFVQTTNNSAPEAKLRREWFITYVSSEKKVVPATTACAANLTDYMLANYTQVKSCRMRPQRYTHFVKHGYQRVLWPAAAHHAKLAACSLTVAPGSGTPKWFTKSSCQKL